MIASILPALLAYGRQLAAEHVELKDFVFGGAEQIMSRSRSDLSYPLLWQEIPDMEPDDNGAGFISAARTCGFVVLDQVADGNEEQVWVNTEQIALDLVSRLYEDRRLRQFGFDLNKVKVEPVSTLFFDQERGWRISFPLTAELAVNYNASRWQKAGTHV